MHHFAFLDCEDAAKWKGHAEAFSKLFPGVDVRWTVVRCYDGALPPISELISFDALALSGSHHSAADNDTRWIPQLAAWLADVVAHGPPDLRIVGLCFGSQILARALGGAVGKNPSGRFVLTVEQLRFDEPLQRGSTYRQALPDDLAASKGCRVLESHGDQVLQLPPEAVRLATSATAENDMWGAAGGRVLAIQGHPEMTCTTALDKILPAVSSKMTDEEVAASEAALEQGGADDAAIMQFIAAFMCGGGGARGPAHGEAAAASSGSVHTNTSLAHAAAAPAQAGAGGAGKLPPPQSSSSAADGRGAEQDEAAAVADVLHRLSVHDSGPDSPDHQQQRNAGHAAPGMNGTSDQMRGGGGCTAADAIASGQFHWAGGFPGTGSPAQQDEAHEQQRLPAGGSAATAEALLSGQFQWGGGGSVQQPLPALPVEAPAQSGGNADDPVATAFGDMERQLDSLNAALDLLDQRSDHLAAKVAAQRSTLPDVPS